MLSEEELFKEIDKRNFRKLKEEMKKRLFIDNEVIPYIEENKQILDSVLDECINYCEIENIILFTHNVSGFDLEKITNCVIQINKAKYIYEYALNVPKADTYKLTNAIINTKEDDYIYKFALNIKTY